MSDEQTAGDIHDYSDRMLQLMDEASEHGIACYAILHTTDPIARVSQTRYLNTAYDILAMGMLNAAMVYQQDEFADGCHHHSDDEDDERV